MQINRERLEQFRKEHEAKIYTMADLEAHYEADYIPSLSTRKMCTISNTLDKAIGMVRPGQVVTYIAPTNVGKTALLTNIARNNSSTMKDKIIPLFECEESAAGMFERFVQLENDAYTVQVEEAFRSKNGNLEKYKQAKFRLPNIVTIIHRVCVDDIIPYCLALKEDYGKDIGFIGLDYLGLVKSLVNVKEYDRVTEVMTKLREIARIMDTPVINFAQPDRSSVKEIKELSLYSGKSSGEIENSSQVLITLQRIDENNIDKQKGLEITDTLRQLIESEKVYLLKAKIEKKKQGSYASAYLLFNTRSTEITEYVPEELF